MLRERHDGHEDVTIITQKDAQETVNRILDIVAGVVIGDRRDQPAGGSDRDPHHHVDRGAGARRARSAWSRRSAPGASQIVGWYLFEAAVTAIAGGALGLIGGIGGAALLHAVIPGLETFTPPGMVIAAMLMALSVGLAAGVAPALRAARLDPVEALRGE